MKEYAYIKKRDGRLAPWDRRKIENAVESCSHWPDDKGTERKVDLQVIVHRFPGLQPLAR
ncbi:MAG: hypothetical protein K6U74_13585 [Firmicutes bacterium]|nr:hypothetical protein [Bacillota bacterium]